MEIKRLLTALIIGGGLGAGGASYADGSLQVVVIDRWWGVDYAKANCTNTIKDKADCERTMRDAYNAFEIELKTEFSANHECAGIEFTGYGYPFDDGKGKTAISSGHYWSFSINYQADSEKQFWQMLAPQDSGLPMLQASGTPSQIAAKVCAIIKGRGGTISK